MIGITRKNNNGIQKQTVRNRRLKQNIQFYEKEIITLQDFNKLPVECKKEILRFINVDEKDIARYLFKEEYSNDIKLKNQLKVDFVNLLYTHSPKNQSITYNDIIYNLPLTEEQKQTLITKFGLKNNNPKIHKLPKKVDDKIQKLLKSKYGLPLIIASLPFYSKLKLKEKKELLKQLGLWEIGECMVYSGHPLTSSLKVEMKLLKVLTHFNIYILKK